MKEKWLAYTGVWVLKPLIIVATGTTAWSLTVGGQGTESDDEVWPGPAPFRESMCHTTCTTQHFQVCLGFSILCSCLCFSFVWAMAAVPACCSLLLTQCPFFSGVCLLFHGIYVFSPLRRLQCQRCRPSVFFSILAQFAVYSQKSPLTLLSWIRLVAAAAATFPQMPANFPTSQLRLFDVSFQFSHYKSFQVCGFLTPVACTAIPKVLCMPTTPPLEVSADVSCDVGRGLMTWYHRHTLTDFDLWLFLFLPFSCFCWLIFGGNSAGVLIPVFWRSFCWCPAEYMHLLLQLSV